MISRDEAAGLLAGIANTTQDAFEEARAEYGKLLVAQESMKARMTPAVAAVSNGLNFWSYFATYLGERYDAHPDISRVSSTHPLAYIWTVSAQLLIQLKSDTGNLPLNQLEIPGVSEVVGGSVECVTLTWGHDQIERFEPCFVQIEAGKEVWRIPVASLAQPTVADITPSTPRSTVSSARNTDDAAAEQAS